MKKASLLNFLLTIALVVIFLTPMLNRNLPRPLQISLFVLYFISLFFEKGALKWLKCNAKIILWIVIWQGLELFYWIVGYSTALSGNYMMSLFSYGIIIVGLFSYSKFSYFQKISIIIVIIGSIIYNIYDNIMINALYGGATNDIYKDWGSDYLETNVAETGFYGAVMLFIGCLSIALFKSKKVLLNVFISIVILLSLGFAFLITPRGIACTFIVVEIAFIMLKTGFVTKQKLFLFLVIALAVFFVFKTAVIDVEDSHGGIGRLAERGTSVLDFINRGTLDDESSFGARINLYLMSLETWLSSPITFLFGIGYHLGDYGFSLGLGQHSRYADVLANYGVLGFTILLVLTYKLYRVLKKNAGEEWYLHKVVLTMYILYGVVDHNRNIQMIIIIFFLLPLINTLYNQFTIANEKLRYTGIKHN